MIEDLKQIKKLYGEAMMHFCRDSFPIILENKGKLPEILKSNFAESHELYNDLIQNDLLNGFKLYIYSFVNMVEKQTGNIDKTPEELMKLAGYTLYKCETERDIQRFKKYYAKDEELCTFSDHRLDSCYVFFAVKENAYEIKRENFKNPERQDKYGTSVISIQFSKDESHHLSIKNRYNHTVLNPDATFGNNLDNIILGLTDSFAKYYGLEQKYKNKLFEIPNYVRANDGRWYKYNKEMLNVYYCPNNIIIDNGEVKKYDKEKYIVMSHFILNLEGRLDTKSGEKVKEITLYDSGMRDSFPDAITNIDKINIIKKDKERVIEIIHKGGRITRIVLDKNNNIIELYSEEPIKIKNNFLRMDEKIMSLSLPNVVEIGTNFLSFNVWIKSLLLPHLRHVEINFLLSSRYLCEYDFSSLINYTDSSFLWCQDSKKKLEIIHLVEENRKREEQKLCRKI